MRRARGFTVMELLVVLMLVGIVSVAAVLGHQAIRPGLHLAVAVRQVVMDLKVARMRAMAETVNHRVVFSPGGGWYRTQRQSGSGYTDTGPPLALPEGVVVADCTAVGDAVTFRPRGHASTFGSVALRNGRGDERRVVIDFAGRVRVQ